MRQRIKRISRMIAVAALLPMMAWAGSIKSPNGNIELKFSVDNTGRPVYEMTYKGKAVIKPSFLGLELAKDIVSRHLTSPSMLCLISFQDWMSIDEKLRLPDENGERINIPANPRHYWRYRMHLTIEQLLAADDLNNEISTLIIQSGRK